MFKDTNETFSAVGAAMQAAYKMVSPTGGRVTVFQHTLPTIGKKKFVKSNGIYKKINFTKFYFLFLKFQDLGQ